MNRRILISIMGFVMALLLTTGWSQTPLHLKNARSWQMGGRIQLQHLFNPDIDPGAEKTRQGFRMRRGRLWVKAQLTDWINTAAQVSIRDANVKVLDLYATLKVLNHYYLKVGQAKVPVWREELRSSGKLILIERSVLADFLLEYKLSSRQIGVELGRQFDNGASIALSLTNGSGINVREDAGRNKSYMVNNGKLYVARANLPIGNALQVGISAAYNQLGFIVNNIVDTRKTVWAILPDFNLKIGKVLEFEGGIVTGKIRPVGNNSIAEESFFLGDVTGRWRKPLHEPLSALAGMDGVEFAAGIYYVDPNASNPDFQKMIVLRGGPALYFGKHARFQVNVEYQKPDDSNVDATMLVRSQITVDF